MTAISRTLSSIKDVHLIQTDGEVSIDVFRTGPLDSLGNPFHFKTFYARTRWEPGRYARRVLRGYRLFSASLKRNYCPDGFPQ